MKIDLGVNIGAGSWAVGSNGVVNLGAHGTAYWYPHIAELDLAASQGVKAVRMGAAHSRFYATPTATALNPDVAKLKEAIRHARKLGMRVYFQFHEYGYAWGQKLTLATVADSVRCYNALDEFKADPGFIACSWNEPHSILADYWPIVTAWHKGMRASGWPNALGISAQNWAGMGQIPEQIDRLLALGDKNILVEGHYYHDLPPGQWPTWSGQGIGRGIWNLTDADIASGAFKAVVDRNFDMAFPFAALRKAGLRCIIGETSLPFGTVGNAVRRYLLPKWEANADVLADRLLWCAAQHMNSTDANALFAEVGGQPVLNDLFKDEVAARLEFEPVVAPPPVVAPVEPPPVVVEPPVTAPATDLAERLAKARLEVNNLKNGATRALYAIDKAIEGLG